MEEAWSSEALVFYITTPRHNADGLGQNEHFRIVL
jgi:hypothetical protein